MASNEQQRRFPAHRPALVVAGLGLLTAAGLRPQVFELLFALQPMDLGFAMLLHRLSWVLGLASAAVGLLAMVTRRGVPAALLLALLLPIGAELGFRTWLRVAAPEGFALRHMARVPGAGEAGFAAETADHPFVNYTGMPFSADGRYNNFGFSGSDWSYEREPGSLRVALLGGSTTEWGLGASLAAALAERTPDAPPLEVLNFGLAGWTSTHSAVNFMLTVQDLAPDAVVIHHGWNDLEMDEGRCLRGDYAHRLATHPQSFAPVPGATALRASALLRLATAQVELAAGRDAMGDIEHSPFTWLNVHGPPEGRSCGEELFRQRGERWPLERNLRAIVALALAQGIQPVILTMPHSSDPTKEKVTPEAQAGIDEANAVGRRVAASTGALLADAAAAMNEREELFHDLGHVGPEGNAIKDGLIADALAAWLAQCSEGSASPCPTPGER